MAGLVKPHGGKLTPVLPEEADSVSADTGYLSAVQDCVKCLIRVLCLQRNSAEKK